MALINWEKIEDPQEDFLVYHNKRKKAFIKIWKPFLKEERHDVVIITTERRIIADKQFEKHAKAIAYAEDYMEKH